ncbi:MFS transporter, partial [Bifidobacterium pseudocatenulatum]|nr:MFS transporter [Bifidobacterium pseudocatenulatum]
AYQSFIVSYVQSRLVPVSSDLFFMFYAGALFVLRRGLRDLFDSKGFRFWLTVCSLGMLALLACMTFLFND